MRHGFGFAVAAVFTFFCAVDAGGQEWRIPGHNISITLPDEQGWTKSEESQSEASELISLVDSEQTHVLVLTAMPIPKYTDFEDDEFIKGIKKGATEQGNVTVSAERRLKVGEIPGYELRGNLTAASVKFGATFQFFAADDKVYTLLVESQVDQEMSQPKAVSGMQALTFPGAKKPKVIKPSNISYRWGKLVVLVLVVVSAVGSWIKTKFFKS